MKDNQIEPLDIEFDDILAPQPVREEPAKEEPTKEVEPVAEIKPADIEEPVAETETEDVDEPINKVKEAPLRVETKDEDIDTDTEEESTVVGEILEMDRKNFKVIGVVEPAGIMLLAVDIIVPYTHDNIDAQRRNENGFGGYMGMFVGEKNSDVGLIKNDIEFINSKLEFIEERYE